MRLLDRIAIQRLLLLIIGLLSKLIDKIPSKSKMRKK